MQTARSIHPSLPIATVPISSGVTEIRVQLGTPYGGLILIETSSAGALYTVPAGKTFTGVAFIAGSGIGSITLSAATGGALAQDVFNAKGQGFSSSSPITVSGGGGGNVLSVTATAAITSVAIAGHLT